MGVFTERLRQILPDISGVYFSKLKNISILAGYLRPLKDIENIIQRYIESGCEEDGLYGELFDKGAELGRASFDADVPIALLFDYTDVVRDKLIQEVLNDDAALSIKVSRFLTHLADSFARGYLQRSANEWLDINLYLITTFRMTYYYSTLLEWMESINNAIRHDDESLLPELDVEKSDFGQIMHQHHLELVCGGNPKNTDLYQSFHSLISTANMLAVYFRQKRYRCIYGMYLDLKDRASKFQQKLSEAYSLYAEDVNYRFCTFVENHIRSGNSIIVTVVNINNLSSIQKIFSNAAAVKVVESLQYCIDRLANEYGDCVVYSKNSKSEFRIAFADISIKHANRIINELRKRISKIHVKTDEGEVPYYLSFGTIYFEQDHEYDDVDFEKLFSYISDRAGRSRKNETFIEGKHIKAVIKQISTDSKNINRLRKLLAEHGIEPYFQPIMNLATQEVEYIEVLGRFHDDNYIKSIGEYIDLLVELDAVVELDLMIFGCILQNLDFLSGLTSKIFINVNPVSLTSSEYIAEMENFIEVAAEKGIEPIFEITEQAILKNLDLIENLHSRKNITFALDDFGTGYSSLKMVIKLAERGILSYIKIDGSLIRDISKSEKSLMVVDSIRYMASNLNIKTVAEFIESPEIMQHAQNLGIDYGQGYHIAKPLSLEEVGFYFD